MLWPDSYQCCSSGFLNISNPSTNHSGGPLTLNPKIIGSSTEQGRIRSAASASSTPVIRMVDGTEPQCGRVFIVLTNGIIRVSFQKNGNLS